MTELASLSAFQFSHVEKKFHIGEDEITILKKITFEIPRGQYVAIMGPSGSGKSTLMQLLGCLDFPSTGRVSVLGHDIATLSDDDLADLRCQALGFVFQAFHLLPSYDVLSNVALSMVYSGHPNRREQAEYLLTQLGMGHRLYARPRTLSGGEQQRVAIARALGNDPPILLADEPTGALDQANGKAIMALFKGFHEAGKTIVLVTHDINVARHAQRVIHIVDGQIHSDGPPR